MNDQNDWLITIIVFSVMSFLVGALLYAVLYLYPSWQCSWTCDREHAESEYRFLAQPACMCKKGDKFFRPGWAIDNASRDHVDN